jgi:hypothetical protein
MKINLRVAYNDGKNVDVLCSAPDFVAFEEKFDRSVAKLEKEFRLTDLLWLAWHALNRKKQSDLSWEKWLEVVDDIDATEDNGPIVPLESKANIGS